MKKLIYILLILFLPVWAGAANYFVDQSGNGAADGSSYANRMSIANYNSGNLNGSVGNGDTVYFCGTITTQITNQESGGDGSHITLNGDCSTQGGTDATLEGADTVGGGGWTSEASITSDNLETNAQEFNSWQQNDVTTGTNDANDPLGNATADGMTDDGDNAEHKISAYPSAAAETDYAFSVYAKAAENDWVLIKVQWYDAGWGSLGSHETFFDVSSCEAGTTGSGNWDILPTANSWCKILYDGTSPVSTANIRLDLVTTTANDTYSYTGDGVDVDTYWAWAKWEEAADVSTYLNDGTYTAYYVGSITTEPEQVFEDGSRMLKVDAKTHMPPKSFWYDSGNSRLYVRTSGDDSPAGYTIKASQRSYGISSTGISYVDIKNFIIQNQNATGIYIAQNACSNINITDNIISYPYYFGVYVQWASGTDYKDYIDILRNTISYSGACGIRIANYSRYIDIDDNDVSYSGQLEDPGSSDQQYTAGIRLVGPPSGTIEISSVIVEKNKSYNNGTPYAHYVYEPTDRSEESTGIWADTVDPGVIIRYNLTHSNIQRGIFSENNDGVIIHGNLVYGNSDSGIVAYTSVSGKPTQNHKIYNNTVYNNSHYGINIQGIYPAEANACVDNEIKNNIVTGNTTAELSARFGGENDGTYGSGNIYTYNCLGAEASNFVEWGASNFDSTYDDWETSYGGTTNSVEADPLFKNAGSNDFTLQPGSPAYDKALSIDGYNTRLRPEASWPDDVTTMNDNLSIGAYGVYRGAALGM